MNPVKRKILLVGNTNCGKTTLFNHLTSSKARVGNWSGVTVDIQEANFQAEGKQFTLCDLPGISSLVNAGGSSKDVDITCSEIRQADYSLLINVVDINNLHSDLLLTLQLRELGCPMLVVLNQISNNYINVETLSNDLGCEVVVVNARTGKGLHAMKQIIAKPIIKNKFALTEYLRDLPKNLQDKIFNVSSKLDKPNVSLVMHALDGDVKCLGYLQRIQVQLEADVDDDIQLAKLRYQKISKVLDKQNSYSKKNQLTAFIDKIVIHKIFGIPIFLLSMYTMFVFAIGFGGAFQQFFELTAEAFFINGITQLFGFEEGLISLILLGLGRGLCVTAAFIPVIFCFFSFLSLLEHSGYIARAVFVVDKLMKSLGLPGKSFVPMIVGFGCNVPGVMCARTLENRNERVLTIMMTPFMSCSARLAIYAVFVAAFFAENGQNVIFVLYLVGIMVAILTGLVLKSSLLLTNNSVNAMELPDYRIPGIGLILCQSWVRLRRFLTKAGSLIIPLCMIINVMGSYKIADSTPLEILGKKITPIFSPMGINQDNWPATVGLLSGLLAKEVVVGTLDALYAIDEPNDDGSRVTDKLELAVSSLRSGITNLVTGFINPLTTHLDVDVKQTTIGIMHERFSNLSSAFAYLLFVLLYFPCVSVVATIARELSLRWAIFSVVWTTSLAYMIAVGFYQISIFSISPSHSMAWVIGIIVCLISIIAMLRHWLRGSRQHIPIKVVVH